MSATGTIKPSLPLLPVLDVVLDPQGFRVGKALDLAKLKPPFQGVKVTEASLMMSLAPAFKPVGTLAFEFGGARKVADLKLTASADDAGLVLKGELLLYIPASTRPRARCSTRPASGAAAPMSRPASSRCPSSRAARSTSA